MQVDNNIDKLFQTRIGNYESKASFDEDLLWSTINKANTSSFTHILRKPSFYIGCVAVAAFMSAAAIITVQHFKIEKLQKALDVQTQVNKPSNTNNQLDSTVILKPEVTENIKSNASVPSQETNKNAAGIPVVDKKIDHSKILQTTNKSTVASSITQEKKQDQIATKQVDSLIQNNSHKETSITENASAGVNQNTVKKITVVKKQIIQKDSV